MKHFSLKKKWLFLSLVLLSPEIFAGAEEHLNFNYTRSDILALDPQQVLQVRACHSLGDPMDIRVRFKNIMASDVAVKLAIKGEDYIRSYTVFSSTLNGTKTKEYNTGADSNFHVPWGVTVLGKVHGFTGHFFDEFIPGQPAKYFYIEPFCFSPLLHEDPKRFVHTLGYPAIFAKPNPPGWDDRSQYWDSFCKLLTASAAPDTRDEDHYWPGYYRGIPPKVQKKIASGKEKFLFGGLFYHERYKAVDAIPDKHSSVFHQTGDDYFHTINEAVDKNADSYNVYTFSQLAGGDEISVVKTGDFTLRLNNRNISELMLTITDKGKSSVFRWKRGAGNTLVYSGISPHDLSVTPGGGTDESSDIYQTSKFYDLKNLKDNYFKGTLVPMALLSQSYKDYIRNVVPLSLPPDAAGNINLVNTDGLTFSLVKPGEDAFSKNAYSITVFGQPLKFGPLKKGDRETLSAMQVRNACY
ncbi:TPA: hypothetical protein ACIBS5_003260 [Salmonella enterica subsp. diarizonae serovar 60-67:z35:-]